MSQAHGRDGSGRLPGWAAIARTSFRLLITAWAVLYVAALVVWIGSQVFDYRLPSGPTSGGVILGVTVAVAALAGVLWLIGEGVAGFTGDREPPHP